MLHAKDANLLTENINTIKKTTLIMLEKSKNFDLQVIAVEIEVLVSRQQNAE